MDEILKKIELWLGRIKNPFVMLSGAFWFTLENYRKRYPYILLGEKKQHVSDGANEDTILLYRIAGKRYVFELPASEICNTKELIGKFHPLDVRVIAFVAGIEQILKTSPNDRQSKFENLKEYIFHQ